jgi:hypothetical protein
MSAQTFETYRGVKIRLKKGREWGYTNVQVNGHNQGDRMELDRERILKILRSYVDLAIAEPDRMTSEWLPGHKGTQDRSSWQGHRCA